MQYLHLQQRFITVFCTKLVICTISCYCTINKSCGNISAKYCIHCIDVIYIFGILEILLFEITAKSRINLSTFLKPSEI